MEVTVNMELTIDERKALMILCEVLDMKELVQSDEELVIKEGYVQKRTSSGGYSIVDERADLFAALRNVANRICPNCEFRSDDYITHYDEGYDVPDDVRDFYNLLTRINELETRVSRLEKRMDAIENNKENVDDD